MRDEALLRRLLEGTQRRLCYPQGVVLLSDGEPSYQTLFPEVFGVPYRPPRNGQRGRFPNLRYRIARTQAHVQIVKQRTGKRVGRSPAMAAGLSKQLWSIADPLLCPTYPARR